MELRLVALAAAEQVPLQVRNGTIAAYMTGPDGGGAYFRTGALDPSQSDRSTTGWAAVLLRLGGKPFIATALGDANEVLALLTRPRDAIDEPETRPLLVDRLMTPPVLGDLIDLTHERHRRLRAEAAERFGDTKAEAHARQNAKRVAYMLIDKMSEDWRYGWDLEPDVGRGRPRDLFKDGGLWALFLPNEEMLHRYVRGRPALVSRRPRHANWRPLRELSRSVLASAW